MARAAAEAQLADLVKALPSVGVARGKHGRTGEVTDLRIRIFRPVVHALPGGDADVSFLVQVSSYRYDMDPRKPAGRSRKDGLYVAGLTLRGLRGKGGVKADVQVPKLENVSPWPAATLLRDEMLDKLQAHLKGCNWPTGSRSGV